MSPTSIEAPVSSSAPSRAQWSHFFDLALLFLGIAFLGAALIYFVAYNWDALGRYAKFALIEILIAVSLFAAWRFDLAKRQGQASLLLATLFLGALLALVGQIYQTGADTYELFTLWALAASVWVLLARLAALWLLWFVIANTAIILYFQTFPDAWIVFAQDMALFWAVFLFNTAALILWEFSARVWFAGVSFLRASWLSRVLASASGISICILVLEAIFRHKYGNERYDGGLVAGTYALWLGGFFVAYRYYLKDLFGIAGAALSLLACLNALLAKNILENNHAGGFLLVGLSIIVSTAAVGLGLKFLAKQMHKEIHP